MDGAVSVQPVKAERGSVPSASAGPFPVQARVRSQCSLHIACFRIVTIAMFYENQQFFVCVCTRLALFRLFLFSNTRAVVGHAMRNNSAAPVQQTPSVPEEDATSLEEDLGEDELVSEEARSVESEVDSDDSILEFVVPEDAPIERVTRAAPIAEIDPTNVVHGKRQRKAPERFQEKYQAVRLRKLYLKDVPPEELPCALGLPVDVDESKAAEDDEDDEGKTTEDSEFDDDDDEDDDEDDEDEDDDEDDDDEESWSEGDDAEESWSERNDDDDDDDDEEDEEDEEDDDNDEDKDGKNTQPV